MKDLLFVVETNEIAPEELPIENRVRGAPLGEVTAPGEVRTGVSLIEISTSSIRAVTFMTGSSSLALLDEAGAVEGSGGALDVSLAADWREGFESIGVSAVSSTCWRRAHLDKICEIKYA
jgi:hypothetical protein